MGTPKDETLQRPHVQNFHLPFSSPPPNLPPPPAWGLLPPHVQQGRPYPGPQFGSPSQHVMFPPGVPLQPPELQRNASQPSSAHAFMHQARVNVNGPPMPGPPHQQQFPPFPSVNSQNLSAFPSAQPQAPHHFNFPGNGILQSRKEEKEVDVKDLLSQIRVLVGQADEVVQKVGKLVMVEPSMWEPRLVTCPYNPTHRVSPEALFKHFLCCPSNPTPKVDAEKLISSLRYPHRQNLDEDSEPENEDHKTLESQSLSLGKANDPNSSLLCSKNMTGGTEAEKDNMKDQASMQRSQTGGVSKASFSDEIDIWGGRFFYKDSPAVVQAPLPTPYPASEVSETQLAFTLSVDKLGAGLENVNTVESMSLMGGIGSLVKEKVSGDGVGPLLSSRFWFLQREIETWTELPTRCSTLVLQVATGVWKIRRKVVSEWVLMQGPAHGIVIDSPMASQIHSLAKVCLKALQKEAFTLIDHQRDLVNQKDSPPASEENNSLGPKCDLGARSGTEDQEQLQRRDTSGLTKGKEEPTSVIGNKGRSLKVSLVDCPRLFQSGQWLALQLSPLFGPLHSKVFVLKLLKHCLVLSGRILASSFIEVFTKQATEGPWQLGRPIPKEVGDVKLVDELQTPDDVKRIDSKPVKSKVETVDRSPLPLEVETAIATVRERAILESYFRKLNYPSLSSKFQMIQEHEATVTMAAAERHKRVNYRPVLEHDGLIWHRSQLEEKNKNKTKEEILAEERDYKRRRMSYRGKKLKRNRTEVLHDLIEGHMEEIVEAGGIGCFVKHTGGELPSAEAGRIDNSRRSSLSSTNDPTNPNQADDAFPPASTSHPMNFDAKNDKGSWNDQSRGRPNWRDDRFNEQIISRTFKQGVNHTGTGSRINRYSEMEDGVTHDEYKDDGKYRSDGSQGKFHIRTSYPSSDSGKVNDSYQPRSARDHSSDSKRHSMDNSLVHSGEDHRKDRSRSQRYSESREGSNEDDSYEKGRSREYRGKSKSSY